MYTLAHNIHRSFIYNCQNLEASNQDVFQSMNGKRNCGVSTQLVIILC
jgi:hypothetical protein